ncbi:MAG: phosphatase PAP2 family protein [Bulleidia sp.]
MKNRRRALYSILLYVLVFLAAARKDLAASEFLTAHGWHALISFGKHAGPLPMFLIPSFCFLSFSRISHVRLYQVIAAFLCLAAGIQLVEVTSLNFPELIAAVLFGVLFWLLLYREAHRFPIETENGKKTAKAGIMMGVWSFFIIQVLKIIWGRPRFISLSDPSVSFEPWFHISGLVFTDDLFKSFPSGHTGAVAMIFWITLLPYAVPELQPERLWILAVLYTFLVALSRIMAGMHYISDVMAGCAVTLSVCQILRYRYFIQPEKEMLHE